MRIYFIGPLNLTFVRNDISILEREHELQQFDTASRDGMAGLKPFLQVSMRSFRAVLRSRVVYCWFADYTTLFPALLARMLRKPVYVVAGGFDARWLPQLNYGAKAKPHRWFCIRNTFRLATRIFAVSQATADSLDELTEGRHGPIQVMYNGVNLGRLHAAMTAPAPPRDIVLTVSQANIPLEMHIKGVDRFVKLAEQVPEQQFVVAGLRGPALELIQWAAEPLDNVRVIPGPLDLETELIPLYRRATAYCQLSRDETFGVSVVEAMACGCAPVVTSAGGLPEVVGDIAEPVDTDEEIVAAIRAAADVRDRSVYRLQAQRFDISHRAADLLAVLG